MAVIPPVFLPRGPGSLLGLFLQDELWMQSSVEQGNGGKAVHGGRALRGKGLLVRCEAPRLLLLPKQTPENLPNTDPV